MILPVGGLHQGRVQPRARGGTVLARDDIMPTYQGPQDLVPGWDHGAVEGFGIGENVERHLNNTLVENDSEPAR